MQVEKSSTPQSSANNKADAAAALRAELELELKNKKQCTYQSYECTQLCIDGFKYCSKHILQDKNAPFKQCSYIYNSNGKRCHLPAPRGDRKDYGYCSEHALKATLARNKHGSKYPPPKSAEALLQCLSHYVKKPRLRTNSSSTQHSDEGDQPTLDEGDLKTTKSFDPFVDLDACSIYNEHCNQILDYCSESESDTEAATYSSVWHDAQADSSGDESIDSEQEDLLKHANVYTAEEITLITRDKLVRLQSLYIEQYRHLQYLLKEKKRKYIHSLRREKETCCNIYSQVRDNPKEQRLYKKLKALNNYQRCHGIDAILNKRLKDLRAKASDGTNAKGPVYTKCAFSEGGVKCTERNIPLSKYCQRHILEDTNQVLFRACGKMTGDMSCSTPIAAVFEESTCPLHKEMPPLRSYSILRKDSESDIDDASDPHLNFSHLSENVKTEFMHYDIPPEVPKMETLPSMLFEENTRSTNDSSNDGGGGAPGRASAVEEGGEPKAGQSDDESMEGVLQVPDFVHEEVEISSEVVDSERTFTDVSGSDIKTETVDVNDMVIVDESLGGEVETAMDTTPGEEARLGEPQAAEEAATEDHFEGEESNVNAEPEILQNETAVEHEMVEVDTGVLETENIEVCSEQVGEEPEERLELVESEAALEQNDTVESEATYEQNNTELVTDVVAENSELDCEKSIEAKSESVATENIESKEDIPAELQEGATVTDAGDIQEASGDVQEETTAVAADTVVENDEIKEPCLEEIAGETEAVSQEEKAEEISEHV